MADRPTPARGRRIGIVRLTSLGDVIHTLPVAAAIRQQEPSARIVWFAEEREQVLLIDNPVVDQVVTVPLRRWRDQLLSGPTGVWRSARELWALHHQVGALGLDAVLDVQGWPHKTSPVVRATHAPLRIGFDRRHARHALATLFTTSRVTPPVEARHIVDQNLALLGPLGLQRPRDVAFPFPEFPEAEARAAAWRRANAIGPDHRVVALLPGTRGPAKRWPTERYRALASNLLADPAVRVVILGGPNELGILEEVRSGLPANRAVAWAPEPIPDLVAALRHVDLAIGNDTGPLHVAAAYRVPSLGLFGPTRGERNGPYGRHCAFVQSPTRRITDITLDAVVAAVHRLTD